MVFGDSERFKMPPKKAANAPSKKNVEKKKEKTIEVRKLDKKEACWVTKFYPDRLFLRL